MNKNKEIKTEKIQIRFTPSEREAIERKAAEESRTVAGLIRMIVNSHVNK